MWVKMRKGATPVFRNDSVGREKQWRRWGGKGRLFGREGGRASVILRKKRMTVCFKIRPALQGANRLYAAPRLRRERDVHEGGMQPRGILRIKEAS